MTIEAKLDALIIALNANTAAHAGSQAVSNAKVQPTPDTIAAKSAKSEVTYDQVKVPFLKLAGLNQDKALDILKPLGLASLKPVKPEQHADVLAKVLAALAELQAGA